MSIATAKTRSEKLPVLKLIQSARIARRLANITLVLLGLAIFGMIFIPWQQSARGTGQVVAFIPQEREQTITSPVKGVTRRVRDGLVEGTRVREGDFIVEIEPYAPNLAEQLDASIRDIQAKLDTELAKAQVFAKNVRDFEAAKHAAVDSAEELIAAAEATLEAKRELIPAYEATARQARQNYERQAGLRDKGIRSERELEQLERDLDIADSKLKSLKEEIEAARREWESTKDERVQKEREAQTKVDYARAMEQDALGKVSAAQKEKRDLEIKRAELDRRVITAPRDGTLFRLNVFERGQQIREGAPLFTLVPDTTERAVELLLDGNDTPLVQPGDHVRLQFEGWPAVQFAGWPSVAVGTFGGEVVTIDPTDDGTGKFRILVQPDSEVSWPDNRYLRQGVRANGWVMLKQVPLGYEVWRQLNGFPPSISETEPQLDESMATPK